VFEICPLCSWEDDGQDDAAFRPRGAPRIGPDVVVGGVNHDYSLTEARANFARDLTAFRPSDIDFVATRMSARVRREIVRAYDRAVDGLTDIERAEDDARYFFARLHGA
jgi:hypothetical protein